MNQSFNRIKYLKELLERIRDIRSSEKMIYRQLLDPFATSVDYNPMADEGKLLFRLYKTRWTTVKKMATKLYQ